ncbi:unnamed protein product, partial [Medioppia subpectinata]
YHLVLAVIVFTIQLKSVNGLSCYVCNSVTDKDCTDISAPNSDRYVMKCAERAAKRMANFTDALSANQLPQPINSSDTNTTFFASCQFCKAYTSAPEHKQCSKLVYKVGNSLGHKVEAVVRDCGGLVSEGRIGCFKVRHSDSALKSEICHCNQLNCNSSHRRVHQNHFWLNYLLSAVISINFIFNFV